MLDAASYVKEAWDLVLSSFIKNAFCNAELMNLEPEPRVRREISLIVIELAETINNLNLSIDEIDLENFVNIDNKINEEYVAALLKDVNELFDLMSIDVADVDDNYIDLAEEIIDSQDRTDFHRFES